MQSEEQPEGNKMLKNTSDKMLQIRREPLVLVGKIHNFNIANIAVNSNQSQKSSSSLNTSKFDLLDSKKEDLHPQYAESSSSYKAKAKFAYAPSEPDELTFSKGDVIDIFGQAKVKLCAKQSNSDPAVIFSIYILRTCSF
jgi:hypothetical protein